MQQVTPNIATKQLKSDILGFAFKELNIILTNILSRILNLIGSGTFGCIVRANILRLLGFSIGRGVRFSSDIFIHRRYNHVMIGDGSFINRGVYFDAPAPVTIGKHCDIGFNTVFTTTQHVLHTDYRKRRPAFPSKPIVVEDFVWIGCNVIVLDGVTIGQGSVVAAGSVVTKDIPPNSLAMGTPARVVRTLEQ